LQVNWLSKLLYFFSKVFRHAKRLFEILLGLVFLCAAAGAVMVSLSERERDHTLSILVASFAIVLVIFGLYSFAKARGIR
jgi:hypothetical protein